MLENQINMTQSQPLFTIFTPTYNRASTLGRVYNSLIKQTYQNFEWLLIDDGSTDTTKDLVSIWISDSAIPIRYIYQENQGKHIAFNKAVLEARGKFFVPLDSDDACSPLALERFKTIWESIKKPDLFSGVCVHCENQQGQLIGKLFAKDILDTDSCELLYKYKLAGEKWGFHRTDILKSFPFPEVTDVKFLPESLVWHAIAKHYKIRCVNEVLRIYYQDNRENRLTLNLLTYEGSRSRIEYYRYILKNDLSWFGNNPWLFIKSAIQYRRCAKILNIKNIYNSFPLGAQILLAASYLPTYLIEHWEKLWKGK